MTHNRIMAGCFWLVLALALGAGASAGAQSSKFEPGKLAVLRVGDGTSSLATHQNPVFIDQYDPAALNQAHPSFSVAIPTRGTNALWINGNASTEGGMERSANHKFLTIPGYCGDIMSKAGTPSRVDYDRGICVVDAAGATHLSYKGSKWYGLAGDKSNPRDAVSDGTNHYWGAGSALGTLFYGGGAEMVPFQTTPSTRAIKIINNTLYASLMASDGEGASLAGVTGGIYSFVDSAHAPVPLPTAAGAAMSPMLPVTAPFTHIVGFDLNPAGTVAYVADIFSGIQKYVKTGSDWKLAYSFYLPGYDGARSGILTNNASTAVRAGCFGLAVDFSAAHPVIFATTTEATGYNGKNVNANRLIRIDDTNTIASGDTITNFAQTLATAGGTNISFRALTFAPE